MKRFYILFAILLASLFTHSQTCKLSVFSTEGDKFWLIINGEKQNETAQTNIVLSDFKESHFVIKIIFENQTIPSIEIVERHNDLKAINNRSKYELIYLISENGDGTRNIKLLSKNKVKNKNKMDEETKTAIVLISIVLGITTVFSVIGITLSQF